VLGEYDYAKKIIEWSNKAPESFLEKILEVNDFVRTVRWERLL